MFSVEFTSGRNLATAMALGLSLASAAEAHDAPELVQTETRDRIDTLHLYSVTRGDLWNDVALDETKVDHFEDRQILLDYDKATRSYVPKAEAHLPDPTWNWITKRWEILFCDYDGNPRKIQAKTRNEVFRTIEEHQEYMSQYFDYGY